MIRIIFLLIALLLSKATILAQESKGVDIVVNISNIKNENGKVMVALYDQEETFLKVPYKGVTGAIIDGKSTVIFSGVDKGTYAIGVFHDEDNNRKLNMCMGMIPKEDTGASNNAPAFFGPPKWEDAKFEVADETIVQTIKLN